MHLVLDLNSIANFLITTQRLLLPQLVSLSIRVIDSSAVTRQFLGPRLTILPIISRAYPGLVDLDLRNTESDSHDFVGWSLECSTLSLPRLQRLVLHSTPASVDWEAINSWNSWTLPSLCHLSVEPGPYFLFHGTIYQLLGTSLLTLSINTGLIIDSTFWTVLPALQELEVTRLSTLDVWCNYPPPALHPIRRVIIKGGWPSNPDDRCLYAVVTGLFKFTDQHSPVGWLICDDESINALNQTQWEKYKKTFVSHSGYGTPPEVIKHVMEKWVTGWDRDESDPHRLAPFERTCNPLHRGLTKGTCITSISETM